MVVVIWWLLIWINVGAEVVPPSTITISTVTTTSFIVIIRCTESLAIQ